MSDPYRGLPEANAKANIRDPSFGSFAKRGQTSKDGYAIRINPKSGKKEMYIAGSRNVGDVASDFIDLGLYQGEKLLGDVMDASVMQMYGELATSVTGTPIPGIVAWYAFGRPSITHYDFWRKKAERKYAKIAKEEGVDTIYGYSRGGAILADMDFAGEKVGLDSAMVIAENEDMMNLREDINTSGWTGAFDMGLGIGGHDNISVDYHAKVHQVFNE